jgi:hypothetical protein
MGLDVLAAGSPSVVQGCEGGGATDVLESTAAAGASGLQYDAITDMCTYVWKTAKTWAGQCLTLRLVTKDGGVHEAAFDLR